MSRHWRCLVSLILLSFAAQADAQYVKAAVASFSTASTSYLDVPGGTISFTPVASTDIWILLFSARLTSSTATLFESAEARYLVNGVEHGMGGTQNEPNANKGGPWQHFYRVTGTTATQTVQVQLRDVTGAGATIENLQIIAFKLPPGADFHYTETPTDQAALTDWTALESLNVSPSSPGRYLVMALANATEAPGTGGIGIRFRDAAGTLWPVDHVSGSARWEHFGNPREFWQSFFLARTESLSGASTFSLEFTGASDPNSTVRYTRIMALRIDAFDDYQGVEDVGVSSTISTTPTVKSTLVTSLPPVPRDYIVIQSLSAIGVVAGSTGQRQVGFESDDDVRMSYDHSMGNDFFSASYSFFDAVTTNTALKYENTFATSNGDEVSAKESVIHVLRLPTTSCVCYRLIGFETGDTSELAAAGAGASAQSLTVRPGSGDFALQEGSASTLASALSPAIDTLSMRFSFLKQTNPGALQTILELKNGLTNLWSLALTTTGELQVQQNEAMGLTTTAGPTALQDNRWYTLRLVYDRAAGGKLQIWIANGLEIDVTHSIEGTAVDAIDLSGPPSPNEFFYDDFYVSSASYPPPLGQIVRRGPNGAGSLTEFDTPVGSATHFENVDEITPGGGGDSDYNQHAASTAATDLYALENSTPGPINAVKPMWRMRMANGSGGGTHDYAWREGGITASTEFVGLGTAFQTAEEIWSVPPNSGGTWTQAKLEALELGASHNGTQGQDTFISWTAAMVDYRPTSNYRSIGTATDETAGTVAVANGAYKVTGTGTSWKTANRGRGDRIQIDGADYTIRSVESETELTLTAPFEGTTGTGKAYTISRQYTTLQAWEDCISATGACSFFPVAGADLVSENRSEVGIAYKDSTFTADIQIDGSVTDADHTITLTADDDNRHYGIPGQGVLLEDSGMAADWIRVRDDFVTVEWLEVANGSDPGVDGVHVQNLGSSHHVIVRNMLFHDIPQYGIVTTQADIVTDIYNNIFYNSDRAIRINGTLTTAANVRILNNTAYNHVSGGAISSQGGASVILARNNVALNTSLGADFDIPNLDPNSSHNIASDATSGTAHSPAGGGQNNRTAADLSFVNVAGGDFHIQSGSVAENAAADLSAIFSFDVDGAARAAAWDAGADDIAATTEVEIVSFTASGLEREVLLRWETASELDNLGFHLYRATARRGPYTRITSRVIPGLGSSPSGASYMYRDSDVANGVVYYYRLEDIETTGARGVHGPVAATPHDGAAPPRAGDDPHRPREPKALITYGNPEENVLRVLHRGPRSVVLELRTEGFYAEPQEDGTIRLHITDFEPVSEEGTPSIPVRRPWVEALDGSVVEIASVTASAVETIGGLSLEHGQLPEARASRGGTIRASRRRRDILRDGSDFFPVEWARLLSVGFQRDVKKAQLELAPLRWERATGRLNLARRLVIRLNFHGAERRYRTRGAERNVIARLATTQRGLYAISHEDVFGRRGGVRSEALRLSRGGKTVPFHLEPAGQPFRPGSNLYFLSKGEASNPYGHEAVFELEIGGESRRMATPSSPALGEPIPYLLGKVELEENRLYQAGLVNVSEPWFWDPLMAPAIKRYTFSTHGLAAGDEAGELTIWLHGVTDHSADPDHHVRAYVNGTFVGELFWNGRRARRLELELLPGVLEEGENVLELENTGHTEAPFSMVMLDRFAVSYPSIPYCEGGVFEGRAVLAGTAHLQCSGPETHVLDVTDPEPRWLTGIETVSSGAVRFRAESGRSYLAVAAEAVLRPEVRSARTSRLREDTRGADYLVIGPASFLDGARPLLEHRRAQGLRVRFAPIEEIYDSFGFGESRPEALRDFLRHAYESWSEPRLKYVLLLGDGTYDFKDYLRTGVVNQVPPLLVKTSYLWTASDPTLAAVHGEDSLPDVAIGRMPAATVEELVVMVDKVLAFEKEGLDLGGLLVLVADDPDRAGDFVANAEALARGVLAGRSVQKLYLGALDPRTARKEITRAFDRGASILSYIGHGGIHLWADENVFQTADVSGLATQEQQPFVLTMNCLNGYFHFPYFDSLAEMLLKAPAKGAIAVFSPSGLSVDAPAHRFHELLLREVVRGGHYRLGDAVLESQSAFAETGAFLELLKIYHLFGDPALVIR